MLAELLPGVRHVRTPFLTGWAYFIAVAMILGLDRLTPKDDAKTLGEVRMAAFVDAIGSAALLVGVSVAAVLIGSLLVLDRWDRWPATWRPSIGESPYDAAEAYGEKIWRLNWPGTLEWWAFESTRWMDEEPGPTWEDFVNSPQLDYEFRQSVKSRFELDAMQHLPDYGDDEEGLPEAEETRRAKQVAVALDEAGLDEDYKVRLDTPLSTWTVRREIQGRVVGELKLIEKRAQREAPEVYNDYDRLSAEAELRFSLAPPLMLIAITLAITWHWAAIVFILIPLALFWAGIRSQDEATGVIVGAVAYGSLPSPTTQSMEAFRKSFSDARTGSSPEQHG